MNDLMLELSKDEVMVLEQNEVEFERIDTQRLDGQSILSIIVTVASLPAAKLLIDALLTISKKRQGSSLKINGLEFQNVSQELIEKILHDSGINLQVDGELKNGETK